MASMQYRYSRGQTGQGAVPRPAWGGGSGARAASPEAGGGTPAAVSNGGEGGKERLSSNQDEVILQLENELVELRNACAWKDQRIAELSRSDTALGRLKRDARLLAGELHAARRRLSESQLELLDLRQSRGEVGGSVMLEGTTSSASRDASGGGDRLRESVAQLQEENRQLRETLARLQDSAPAARPPTAGAQPPLPCGHRPSDPMHGSYMATVPAAPQLQEEQVFAVIYSTVHTENTTTIGPTSLQGIGTVDGVSSVAKVLLSRIHSSVCAAHRRPVNPTMPSAPVQPMQPGQIPMVMMGMPQQAM